MTVVYSDGTSITVPAGNRSGLDITLFLNAMKDQYLPMWGDAINKSAPLKSLVPTAGTIIGGKRSLTSIRTGNVMSAGVGFFEHDTLAPPKQPTYEQPELFARAVNTRVRITGHVERAGRAGRSAVFTNAMKDLLKSARTQHARHLPGPRHRDLLRTRHLQGDDPAARRPDQRREQPAQTWDEVFG